MLVPEGDNTDTAYINRKIIPNLRSIKKQNYDQSV